MLTAGAGAGAMFQHSPFLSELEQAAGAGGKKL